MQSPPVDPWPRLFAEEPFVRSLARALAAGDPDDVVQQTYLRALGALPEEVQQPRAWLARIVRSISSNLRRDRRRRLRRERAVAVSERVPSSAELLLREEQRQKLVQAVDALPPPLRAIVLLRWFEGLPPRRIARELGLPVATVWNRLRSGLAALRQQLDAEHGGDRRAWAVPFAAFGAGLASPPVPLVDAAGTALPSGAGVGGGLVIGGAVVTIQTKVAVGVGVVLVLALAFALWRPASSASPAAPPREPEPGALVSAPVAATVRDGVAPAPASAREPVDEAPAATTGSLLVRVRWSDDSPASGITAIVAAPGADFRTGRLRAVCDADGTARFDGLVPGEVRAFTDRPLNRSVKATIEAGRTVDVVCKLNAGVTITGIVVDKEQRPVPAALVEATTPASGDLDIETLTRTGADGRFVVQAGPEFCVIGARAAGFAASPLQYLTGKDGNSAAVLIELTAAGGTVDGRVTDASGKPVAGAIVRAGRGLTSGILSFSEGAPPAAALARTDADGRFVAVGLEPGAQPVEARARGFAPWRGEVAVAAGAAAPLPIVLQPGGAVRGVVRDAEGLPVAKAQVSIGTHDDFAQFRTRSDDHGAFMLASLPVGEVRITAGIGNGPRTHATVQLVAGREVACDFQLESGRELKGRVVDDLGAPVANAYVELSARERSGPQTWGAGAQTGEDGTFAIGGGPSGTFRADVRGAEIADASFEGIDFAAPAELRVRRLGKPDVRIVGIVHDEDGKPQANATVDAVCQERRNGSGHHATDMEGRFELGPVQAGLWQVRVRAQGCPETRTEWRELAPAAQWDVGVIRFARGGAVVIVPSGDPKLVAAAAAGYGYRVIRSTPTGTGHPLFEFYGMSVQDSLRSDALAPGDYLLRVCANGAVEQLIPFTIRPGEDTKVAVALQPGIRQRLVLAPPAGIAAAPRSGECLLHRDAELAVVAWPRGDAGGPIEAVVWLLPGSYSLTAKLGELRGEAAFSVGDKEGEPLVVPVRQQ